MECIVRNIEILQDSRHTGAYLHHIAHPLTLSIFPHSSYFKKKLFMNYLTVIIYYYYLLLFIIIYYYSLLIIKVFSHTAYDVYKCLGPYDKDWGCCAAAWHPSIKGCFIYHAFYPKKDLN